MSENQDAGQKRKVGIMMDGAMVLSKLREMNFSVFFSLIIVGRYSFGNVYNL